MKNLRLDILLILLILLGGSLIAGTIRETTYIQDLIHRADLTYCIGSATVRSLNVYTNEISDGTAFATIVQIDQAVDEYKTNSEIATQIEAYGYYDDITDIPAGITRDAEWNTEAEVEAIWTAIQIYTSGDDYTDWVIAYMIAANAVDSDQYIDSSIDHEHLSPDVISGLGNVTSADGDYMMIWDVSDSTLKKCDMGEVRGGGAGASPWTDSDPVLEPTDTRSVRTKIDFQLISAANRFYKVNDWAAVQVAEGLYVVDSNGVKLATVYKSGIIDMPLQSKSRVYRSVAQSINSGNATKVQFNAESYDTQNEFDSTTNYRWTAKEDGFYSIDAQLQYVAVVADTTYRTYLYKNGGLVGYGMLHSSCVSNLNVPFSDNLYLAAGDYLEIWAFHSAGSAKNVNGTYSFLAVYKLG